MQAAKLQTNHLTAPIGMGTGRCFYPGSAPMVCTDRTAYFSYGFSSYGPHSCSLRYAGINSVVL